jgi:DNA repair protein RadA/Sms
MAASCSSASAPVVRGSESGGVGLAHERGLAIARDRVGFAVGVQRAGELAKQASQQVGRIELEHLRRAGCLAGAGLLFGLPALSPRTLVFVGPILLFAQARHACGQNLLGAGVGRQAVELGAERGLDVGAHGLASLARLGRQGGAAVAIVQRGHLGIALARQCGRHAAKNAQRRLPLRACQGFAAQALVDQQHHVAQLLAVGRLQRMHPLVHRQAMRLGQRVKVCNLLLQLGDAGELQLVGARSGRACAGLAGLFGCDRQGGGLGGAAKTGIRSVHGSRYSPRMAKEKTTYACNECGGTSPKWLGKCPHCGAWNTLIESVAESTAPAKNRFASLAKTAAVTVLADIDATDVQRTPTGHDELDRVLGGGIVEGGVVLIGGDPGIGKSTLLLQALDSLQRAGLKTLYVTGEESGAQVALRSRRLGLEGSQVSVLAEIQLEKMLATLDATRPAIAVIDSIQTVYSEQLTSAPGSVAQVRECAAHLTRAAKASGTAIVLVGHVTKEGALAGPRVLEHMVDTVLYFEGDTHSSFRLIRAIKNRFGAVNEIGVFAMTERGLKGVSNPSAIFLSQHSEPVPGSCVMVTLEGTRPMLVEIQALVDSGGPSPRRLSVGLDRDRLAMLLAVLHRHAGVACMDQDVFVNAVGGVRISEPAADLAVMLAITSSLRGKALPKGFIAFGEVGLAGEVRPAPRGQERLKEAAKLGFSVAVVPKANAPKKNDKAFEGLTIHPVERIEEAMNLVRGL